MPLTLLWRSLCRSSCGVWQSPFGMANIPSRQPDGLFFHESPPQYTYRVWQTLRHWIGNPVYRHLGVATLCVATLFEVTPLPMAPPKRDEKILVVFFLNLDLSQTHTGAIMVCKHHGLQMKWSLVPGPNSRLFEVGFRL